MTRLELLKKEKEAIKKMQTLSYNLIDQCCEWYDHEIECIEKYGSPNPDVSDPKPCEKCTHYGDDLHGNYCRFCHDKELWEGRE